MTIKSVILGAVAAAALTSAAQAATFNLSYTDYAGFDYSADITADLAGDGNTLTNIAFGFLTVDGTDYATGIVGSFSNVFGGSTFAPVLTLDGSAVDFYIADSTTDHGFSFESGVVGWDVSFTSLTAPGGYIAANYSLVETTAAVPLPAGLPLALTGVAGLVALRRRAA